MAFSDIFDELGTAERVSLLGHAESASYPTGAAIITQGQPNKSIFILFDGQVHVECKNSDGEVRRITTLELGEIFGEISFLTGEPATANVIAEGDVKVMRIGHSLIRSMIKEDSAFAGRFFHSIAVTLAKRLGRTNTQL